ncbi:MAG: exodeoxyribonuclease I [Candidatus Saccharibacteria bacterium]|nr:exodeoxyribonuclease I [Candidatus Saccharibacteria bacterium]
MRSFFFYDLETSGFSPRYDRIMQFAGQRTNENLEPIGEPANILVKMTDDTLPSPGAILTTHITPQQTLQDGISEADFCRYFLDEIARPDTIILGYNSVRFDDEFMRHTLWRNFHDAYEWSWAEGRSRWDLLDVTRLIRALRPDGVTWPVKESVDKKTGDKVMVPTVNLVDMARENGFENQNAHDALADVNALINLAKLLRDKQPKMWGYLLAHRGKKAVLEVICPDNPTPFVYASGRYPSANEKTSVAIVIGKGRTAGSYLTWDLRYSVDDFIALSDKEMMSTLTADWETRQREDYRALPIKEISPNKCPAVAPLGTLDESAQERVHLSRDTVKANYKALRSHLDFIKRLNAVYQKQPAYPAASDVEGKLYDSFTPDSDKTKLRLVAAASESELADLHPQFVDERLSELLLRYKARQYPRSLSEDEQKKWEQYRLNKLQRALPNYMQELSRLASAGADDFILQELQLWVESIIPVDY